MTAAKVRACGMLYINILGILHINILFFPVFAASILGRYASEFAAAYICALIHECAHMLTAKRLGTGIAFVEIQPFGVSARLKCGMIKNPMYEILIALAGPLSNMVLLAAGIMLKSVFYTYKLYYYFIYCNAAMAVLNMLPILPLDGGRILRAALSCFIGSVRAYRITVRISRVPILLIFAAAAYGLIQFKFNFSLILISAFLLTCLLNEQKNISKSAVYQILDGTKKTVCGEPVKGSVFAAHRSTPARFILRHLSSNRCGIICVTDDSGEIIGTLTEAQLLNGITERGIRISLGELCR